MLLTPLYALLVHDPAPALAATNRLTRLDLVRRRAICPRTNRHDRNRHQLMVDVGPQRGGALVGKAAQNSGLEGELTGARVLDGGGRLNWGAVASLGCAHLEYVGGVRVGRDGWRESGRPRGVSWLGSSGLGSGTATRTGRGSPRSAAPSDTLSNDSNWQPQLKHPPACDSFISA